MFGSLRIDGTGPPGPTGDDAIPLRGAAAGLFAYLVLHPTPHGRERLAEVLWPDLPAGAAHRSLARAMHQLRRTAVGAWIVPDRRVVHLRLPDGAQVDVHVFEAAVEAGGTADLERALAVYAGPLLPDLYDDWIAPRRAALADAHRTALVTLGRDAEAGGALDRAFRYYHRLAAADRADESGHCGLMRTYLRAGHPTAVLQQYEILEAVLRDEYGIEPGEEARSLVAVARRDVRGAPLRPVPPFVGRRRERAQVLEILDRSPSSAPELVLLEGDAGIGKTRLLEVLEGDARWRGILVAHARTAEHGAATPYAPLDAALRALLSPATIERVRRTVPAGLLDAAARIVPELATGADDGGAPLRVPAGLASVLRALEPRRRMLLVLDDVHRAGPAFWDALAFLEQPDAPPVMVILSFRTGEARSVTHAWSALLHLDATLRPHRIQLGGIEADDVAELATALGHEMDASSVADLVSATRGIPLHLQEALLADRVVPRAVPAFPELLERRLDRLSPPARRALDAAAVIGSTVSEVEWLGVAGSDLGDAIAELLASRLVTEASGTYILEHDLMRQHVYARIDDARRRELHAAAAGTLRGARSDPAVIAWHLARSGSAAEAAMAYRRAAADALRRHAHREAAEEAERGLALAAPGDPARAGLLTLRHRALGRLLDLERWRTALDGAELEARATGDAVLLVEALEGRLSLHALDGNFVALEAVASDALSVSRTVDNPAAEARLLSRLAWHVSESSGDNRRAITLLRRASRLAESAGDDTTLVGILTAMSSAFRSLGRCRASYLRAIRAIAVVEVRPALHAGRVHALTELAETAMELGRWQEARDAIERAIAGHREIDDPWSLGSCLHARVLIAAGLGRPDDAVEAAAELVALGLQVGLAPTSDYGVWHRTSLARAYLAGGDTTAAARVLQEVEDTRPSASRPRIALGSVVGQVLLAQGDPAGAMSTLQDAYACWLPTPEPRDASCALWLAVAAARAGDDRLAREALDAATAVLDPTDIERYDVLIAWARHVVTGSPTALEEARQVIRRQAARITDPQLRASFEDCVPLHREVARLSHRTGPERSIIRVRLAREDVPLGRPIRDDEWVEVRWSTPSPGDGVAGREARGAHRRAALVRLIEEARAAGARATDEQLARALGVSRRTVLRDMKTLATTGDQRPLQTRRRRVTPA